MHDLKDLKLVILPGKCFTTDPQTQELYNSAYSKWKQLWQDVFTEVGSPQAWHAEGFFRADRVLVILHKNEIAGLFVNTIYPLQECFSSDHYYFSIIPSDAIAQLKTHGMRHIMSLEFLSVFPEYRKKLIGYSLGAVLMGVALRSFVELGVDACTGIARKATKVDILCREFGCNSLVKEVKRGNLDCEIIWYKPEDITLHADFFVRRVVDHLWEHREIVDGATVGSVENYTKKFKPKAA